ncbi:ATP-binding cassette domain-containing protein [uncultured Parasphingorhabdus sp.]|uniref:ATP-binding cassette domain-containing protein n=1 Tax=uncultured Parasphingorhabdus sp. TaxID=2709694 RepID=UPI0030DA2A18|tara:strand:+ start:152725 stop:154506 length:1782 start_codon:yes stop_codon:yes gene_type:complete
MTSVVATASNIVKRFYAESGKSEDVITALNGVDFDVRAGEITGLVGPDGAGKTTLIRLLAGLMKPDDGDILVDGIDVVADPESVYQRIGYMPQRFGLYEDLSVQENLDLYADLRDLKKEERQDTFARLLDFTDLDRFKARLAGNLSGGMKQKLGLACALINTPTLLLLDEPGVGVDPVSRRELWKMVKDLTGEGIGIVWSTAYLDEAEACDHVHLLNHGQKLFGGKPQDLTGSVRNRVFRLENFSGNKREVLASALNRSGVRDGTIQGSAIRLLFAENAVPNIEGLSGAEKATLVAVEPRFEDAFIDILGGGPDGHSALASDYREIEETDSPQIVADRMTKRFGDFTAAHDMHFSVKRGEIFGLLGPNGAGKSTTFKMLCGLLSPTEGNGSVAGYDLRHSRADARGALGYMAQKFSLYGELSVRQNLEFFAGIYGLSGKTAAHRIEAMIDTFELRPFLNSDAGGIPLGFKQRLALCCAVMHQPPVLFLDEPTSGVDPTTRREFWQHINGLVEKGVTVLVTTHFMEEAEYCDRIALIYRAETIAFGTPDDLKKDAAQMAGAAADENFTMEDAFIAMIENADLVRENSDQAKAAA